MEIPTRQELLELIEERDGDHISLFTPTERLGPETQSNYIRLKNLRTEAEQRLIERGMRPTEALDMLKPVQALEDDADFWQHQSDGLAVFLSSQGMRWFRVPLELPEKAFVQSRFHVKPLLPLLTADEVFHVLAISANETRVLACTPHAEDEARPEGLPRNIADVLWRDEPDNQLQFRSFSAGGSGMTAFFHGAGGTEPDRKHDLLRYFRMVDDAMAPYMRDHGGPLVLACVDYLAPIYREANSYDQLLPEHVPGNPDETHDQTLRTKAWELVKPRVDAAREEALERYRSMVGTGLTTNDPAQAALAASTGRVDTVFVTVGKQVWGHVDAEAYSVRTNAEPEEGDYDLLDAIAAYTLSNSGTVYAVEKDAAPEPTGVAALLRY